MFKNPLLKIALAPALVLVLHIIATVTGWYETYWWFDIPMHFLGGISIAFSTYYLFQDFGNRKQFNSQSKILDIFILIAFAALAAACWELMEYALDSFLQLNLQPGVPDTMKDMCMGILGGGFTAILIIWKRK